MLYRKHLHPWLLVYLIATILLFLCTVGVIVVIIMNDINGFLFTPYTVSSCLYSTNIKLSTYMEVILKICFILAIVGIVFAMGQLLIVAWQVVKFMGLMNETDDDQMIRFEQLSVGKLIVLYIFSFGGILTMVPVFGTFLSAYVEFQTCQQIQNKSQSYFIPFVVAGAALFFQLFAFILLLKLFYHYRQEQLKLQNQETSSRKWQREQRQFNDMKRRMSLSRNNLPDQQRSPFQNSFSEQQSPRDFQTGLLGKGSDGKNLPSGHDSNTIYSNNQIRDRSRQLNSQPNSTSMSPNSISARQKQVMKTLPRHPFKKNVKQKFGPGDVIFEQSQSQDGDGDYDALKKSRQSQQTQHASTTKPRQQPQPKISMSQHFRQRYQNSPYLGHLQNKAVTPQQRRAIKRPFLKMSKQLVEFDSRNYEADEISILDLSVERKRSKNSVKSSERKYSEGMNSVMGEQRRKDSLNDSNPSVTIAGSNTSANKKASKLRQSFLRERSARESRNLQDENPIASYITQDQTYDEKLNKILQFERLNMRRRHTYAIPSYLSRYEQAKQTDGKLYLHKNKIDGLSNAKNFNDINEENQGYDPFRDEAYDDQLMSHRGFMDDEVGKSGQKGEIKRTSTKDLEIPIMQAKKASRKDGMLLDFIRSKHVMD